MLRALTPARFHTPPRDSTTASGAAPSRRQSNVAAEVPVVNESARQVAPKLLAMTIRSSSR